ncbi:MAG TPA: pantoate--beta-alanine ligase [Bacteroidales bacterium]|nr:pantoate--beta-alanine ligase [Bacteroidales bacterium]
MKIIRKVSDIIKFREQELKNLSIGFVPTMGALHTGHISLVEKSVRENNYTIVSIFVNPKQFNDKNDFINYPVTIEKDLEMLEKSKCNLVFIPDSEDIYNNYTGFRMDFDGLDKLYEGEFRPGHFQGVVDIVYRLFEIVKPHNSYFGEKDFQQLAIIKLMVSKSNLTLNIIPCATVREESGLAMSSRNERLSAEERKNASKIFEVLNSVKNSMKIDDSPEKLINKISEEINLNPFLKTEYVAFCDPTTLKPVFSFSQNSVVRLCVAVWCGKIRLIDNISLEF